MKFKVGDKVRVVRSSGVETLERRFSLTLVGAIGRIDRWDYAEWRVILDDKALGSCAHDGSWGLVEDELELVSEASTTAFKPGDRVRVKDKFREDIDLEPCDVPLIGTIIAQPAAGGEISVKFDDPRFHSDHPAKSWGVPVDWLERIDEAPATKPAQTLSVGARVRLTAKGYEVAKADNWWGVDKVDVGREGKIISKASLCWEFVVNFGDNIEWYVRSEHIELIADNAPTTKPTLSVGARVRVRRLYDTYGIVPEVSTAVVGEKNGDLCVTFDDSGAWAPMSEVEVLEVLSPGSAPIIAKETSYGVSSRQPVAKRRPYAAPRNTTPEEAKVGDDRPGDNEAFAETMLAYFDENDANALLEKATKITRRLTPVGADVAIDLALFAKRIRQRLSEPAA